MKILHAIRSTNPAGGGPIESIIQADRALREMGHASHIVCLDPPSAPWIASAPVPTTPLGPAWTLYHYSPRWTAWLRQHVREFDAVIVHGIWRYPSLGTWRVREEGVPYFVYAHGMLDPALQGLFLQKHALKNVVWKLWEHRVVRDAAAVLFTCEEEQRLARESYKPYSCREAVVPYCVGEPPPEAEKQRAAFLNAFPQLRDRRIILFLSRIHPKKGCDLLIQAFAQIAPREPDIHLVMAGPDPIGWRGALEQMANRLGIAQRTTWTGMLTGDLKWGAFRCADVFALPSHQENFGIAVVEALACGTPTLITRRANIWREIEQAGAGFAADSPSVPVARHLLESWLALSPDRAAARRHAARNCFQRHFRADVAAQRLLETLRRFGAKG
jgi:glycosyltransferase involved in cell wall biosynthesis